MGTDIWRSRLEVYVIHRGTYSSTKRSFGGGECVGDDVTVRHFHSIYQDVALLKPEMLQLNVNENN